MTIEVVARQTGALDVRDLPADAHGDFRVVVLADAGIAFVGSVTTAAKPSGRGLHRALSCPGCGAPKLRLLADRRGGLGCAGCLGRLTRRQAERTCRSWYALGGQIEHRILGLLTGRRGTAAHERAAELIDELRSDDQARWENLASLANSALLAVSDGVHEAPEGEAL